MSNIPQELEEHAKAFVEANAFLEQKTKELKEARKKITQCKKEFKKYMVTHKIKILDIGGKRFSFEPSEKVVVTLDRIENSFPESAVTKYKQENTEKKTVFTCS